MSQSRTMSGVEAVTNTVVGFAVALATQYAVFPLVGVEVFPLVGVEVSHATHWAIAAPFVATSILRSYLMRRFFNWLHSIEVDV